jgi:hypothetical protein
LFPASTVSFAAASSANARRAARSGVGTLRPRSIGLARQAEVPDENAVLRQLEPLGRHCRRHGKSDIESREVGGSSRLRGMRAHEAREYNEAIRCPKETLLLHPWV